MNTFPPPPEMHPGGYQNLPPRNPRSGRAAQPAPASVRRRKTSDAASSGTKKNNLLLGITTQQWLVLFILFVCFLIPLFLYISSEGKLKNLFIQHEQLIARHKVRYEDQIRYYAAVNNIDPAFVAAIIKRESDYDPRAVSSAGARGLMQIMPENIDWLAGKVGLYDYAVDTLFDAEENIKMGCWYLGYLSRLFDGDPITVACAYHAGQGNVRDHWLPKYSANGKTLTLDEIPMDNTKYYARKVLEAYAIYQQHHYKTPDSDAGIMPAL